MSRDEFMKEFACCTENERRNDLPRAILDGRPQFLFAVYEATHYRLTASELSWSSARKVSQDSIYRTITRQNTTAIRCT